MLRFNTIFDSTTTFTFDKYIVEIPAFSFFFFGGGVGGGGGGGATS